VNEAFFYGEAVPKKERKAFDEKKKSDKKRGDKKGAYENLMNVLPKRKKSQNS